ncbi:MAG TPA: ABC transporter ATP-binding protein [Lachnospiraceae bacterium]|jgi:ABC-type transport system involved in Fe-S cluster assembly, ATPase component|nr:ABC transporter ATP-binding protein [Lachnospiraceae bacterium]
MLELKNISYTVEGEKDIINNVSLKVEDAKFIVITGPNGSGKSTLAKIIAGIVKPTKGEILFDGQDITQMSITDRAKLGISFAFQQPVRFKGVTVKDLINLASGQSLSTSEACQYLSEVGLCARDYIDREVNASLSGGELKRIEIATIMARKTKVSVFDEPEAGIDIWSFKNLIDVFEKIHTEIKGTIIIISHQERILNIADEIIVLANGGIATRGTKEEIMPTLLEQAEMAYSGCQYYREEE